MHENTQQVDVIVVSPYSTRMEEVKNGSAKFIRQLLDNTPGKRFLVLNAFRTVSDQNNTAGNVKVVSSWKKNSFFPFFHLINIIKQYKSAPVIINFEFNAFGGMLGLFGLALTILMLKVTTPNKIKVIVHPALLSTEELILLGEHLSLKSNGVAASIYGLGMKIYMKYLAVMTSGLVVFEEEFKRRLISIAKITPGKIVVIPHHVYGNSEKVSFKTRADNDILNVLFFGFIVPYKGLDTLVNAFEDLSSEQYSLTVAGGKSPTQANQEYFSRLVNSMNNKKTIHYLGYRPDNEIAEIFGNADVLVLPYKNLLASSGPMAWAIGMEVPFLISSKLEPYLMTEDFQVAMKSAQLTSQDIVYGDTVDELRAHLVKLHQNNEILSRLKLLSTLLRESRDIKKISSQYLQYFLESST